MSDRLSPLPVAVVGLGRAGCGIHLKALRADARYRVVAVSDPDSERARSISAEMDCPAFDDLSSLLGDSHAELIVLATPSHLHANGAIEVLQAGRHCVLEKPMAPSYAEASAICEEAEQSGRMLAVNHSLLYSEEYSFLTGIISSGILGEVFEIGFDWSSYKRRNDWQTLRKNGGGHLANHGTHALSLMLPLLGSRVTSLLGATRLVKDAGDAEDHARVLMITENGRIGNVMVSTCNAQPGPRFSIYGSRGTMIAGTDGTATLRYYEADQLPPLEVEEGPRQKRPAEDIPWIKEVRLVRADLKFRGLYDNIYRHLNQGEPLLASGRGAAEVTRIIEWAISGTHHALQTQA